MAGDRIDEAVMAYVRRRHNLVIGEKTAEEIKMAIGSALPIDEGLSTQVRGRDQLSGLPKTITLNSVEVSQSIQDCLGTIVQTVRAVLEKTPPELAADVIDRGIMLTRWTTSTSSSAASPPRRRTSSASSPPPNARRQARFGSVGAFTWLPRTGPRTSARIPACTASCSPSRLPHSHSPPPVAVRAMTRRQRPRPRRQLQSRRPNPL
jgi:hypothetical protein